MKSTNKKERMDLRERENLKEREMKCHEKQKA